MNGSGRVPALSGSVVVRTPTPESAAAFSAMVLAERVMAVGLSPLLSTVSLTTLVTASGGLPSSTHVIARVYCCRRS